MRRRCDRLRRRLPLRPVPARDGRAHPRRSTRRCSAGTARTWPRSGSARSSRAEDLAWLQALPLTTTVDGVLYCHAAPDQQPADHDRDHARGRGQAERSRRRGHGCDRPHAPPVRPRLRRPPRRQRRIGRDAVRGRGRSLLDARRGRRALVPAHRRSTSSVPSSRRARARGRTRQGFVAENLLVAPVA